MGKHQPRNATKRTRTRLFVVPQSSAWALREAGGARASNVYKTQREAVAAARGVDTYALGEGGFEKINAVEGIFLSEEMKRDFRALDRKQLSPEKRREWLVAKYCARSDDIRRRK